MPEIKYAYLRRTEAGDHRPDPVAVMLIPDIEAFEERAAIAEYDGGLSRAEAEDLAARQQGFAGRGGYWQWLADYVMAGRLP